MTHVIIRAALPQEAALELSARLGAARPDWDADLTGDGLVLYLPYDPQNSPGDLELLEQTLQNLEKSRKTLELDLIVERCGPPLTARPPRRLGPWEVYMQAGDGDEDQPTPAGALRLPAGLVASGRLWQGAALLAGAVSAYLAPPPGAPETRDGAGLFLEGQIASTPVVAIKCGLKEAILVSETGAEAASVLAGLNHCRADLEINAEPFSRLVKDHGEQWREKFNLITLNLSPYLAARRLKIAASWLRPKVGRLFITGFAPGPQTAYILRAAAKAGLALTRSSAAEPWALLELEINPFELIDPITLGQDELILDELPPEELARLAAEEALTAPWLSKDEEDAGQGGDEEGEGIIFGDEPVISVPDQPNGEESKEESRLEE